MHPSTNAEPQQPVARRSLLKALMGFSIVATTAGVLTPIIGYLWPPARRQSSQGGRIRVASRLELETAGGLVASAGSRPVVLTFSENAGVKAYSAICTHLGCVVRWHNTGRYIECPCHDGRFNAQTGAVISGPPPSPLPPIEAVVDGEDVYIIG